MARALRLWREFAGLPAGPDHKAVHDGRFQGLPGAAPFNWSINSGSAGVAERIPAPALQVEFYGRETIELARQLMVLRPGRYRLEFRAEGNAKGDDSRLAWRIFCQGGTTPDRRVRASGHQRGAASWSPASSRSRPDARPSGSV